MAYLSPLFFWIWRGCIVIPLPKLCPISHWLVYSSGPELPGISYTGNYEVDHDHKIWMQEEHTMQMLFPFNSVCASFVFFFPCGVTSLMIPSDHDVGFKCPARESGWRLTILWHPPKPYLGQHRLTVYTFTPPPPHTSQVLTNEIIKPKQCPRELPIILHDDPYLRANTFINEFWCSLSLSAKGGEQGQSTDQVAGFVRPWKVMS